MGTVNSSHRGIFKDGWYTNKIIKIEDDQGNVHTSHRGMSDVAVNFWQNLLGMASPFDAFPPDITLPGHTAAQVK